MLKSIPVKVFNSNDVCIIDEEDKSVRGEYTTDQETESLIIRYPVLQIALMEEIVGMEDSMAHMPDLQEEGFGFNHDFATKEWDLMPILSKVFKQTWPVKDEEQNFIGFRTMSALPKARKLIRKLYAENKVDPIITHLRSWRTGTAIISLTKCRRATH